MAALGGAVATTSSLCRRGLRSNLQMVNIIAERQLGPATFQLNWRHVLEIDQIAQPCRKQVLLRLRAFFFAFGLCLLVSVWCFVKSTIVVGISHSLIINTCLSRKFPFAGALLSMGIPFQSCIKNNLF